MRAKWRRTAYLLLVHVMPAIVYNDIESSTALTNDSLQEIRICLVACEDGGLISSIQPFVNALLVVLDEVEVDVGQVFEPGIIRRSGSIVGIATKSNLQKPISK